MWNCRGASSSTTIMHLIDMLKLHRPAIVALLEPKVHSSKANKIIHKTYLTNVVAVEVVGFAGGIWLFWDGTCVEIDVIYINDQILTMGVKSGREVYWLLSIIYASPNVLCRVELWQYLEELGGIIHIPWMLVGDFNQPMDAWDK